MTPEEQEAAAALFREQLLGLGAQSIALLGVIGFLLAVIAGVQLVKAVW